MSTNSLATRPTSATPTLRWLPPILLAFGLLSAAAAIGAITMLSAARAYVGGESHWSRAQKVATQALRRYAESGREADWAAWERAVAVPLGDRRARDELDKRDYDFEVVREGFVAGENHPEDIPGMAQLYRWFGRTDFMAEPIAAWREGDLLIDRLREVAGAIRRARADGASPDAIAVLRARVDGLDDRLTPIEARFSAAVAKAARRVADLLAAALATGAVTLGLIGFYGVRRAARRDAVAAQSLGRSEALFRSLWETTSDAVLIVGVDHGIRFANPAAHELLGHAPGTLIGQPLAVLQPERLQAGHRAGVARHLATGERRLDWRGSRIQALHRLGHEVAMEIRFARLDLDGQVHFVGFMRDIEDRLRAEREIQEAQQRLEQRVAERTAELVAANERLLALDRLKSEFLATMSHELRTPLNSILGFTDVLRAGLAGPLNDEQHRQLDFVKGSGQHLLALISDALDLSRIESGRMKLDCVDFDIASAVDEVVAQMGPLAQRKGLALVVQTPRPAPWTGDRRKVVQVLINLVGNAVKFTERGSVTIRVAPGSELVLEVADTGVGIATDQMPHLFQAFHQVDRGIGRSHEGTGLGLHLTRKLLDLMGGRIDVTSRPGAGTTFRVVLPRAVGAASLREEP